MAKEPDGEKIIALGNVPFPRCVLWRSETFCGEVKPLDPAHFRSQLRWAVGIHQPKKLLVSGWANKISYSVIAQWGQELSFNTCRKKSLILRVPS